MTPITAKAGDAIRIDKQLTEGSGRDGTPVDLTDETVRVYVQYEEDALVANQEVEYVDRATGKIAVVLQPSQTSNIGRHNIEWVVNPQGDPTTFPKDSYDTLRTESPLDRELTPSEETPPDLTVTTLTVEDSLVVDTLDATSAAVDSAPSAPTDIARKAETDALGANKADLTAPDGVLQSSQVPDLSITETFTVTDQAARLSLDVQEGDVAIQTDNDTTYIFTGGDPSVNSNWSKIQLDVLEAIDGSDITPSSVTTPSVNTDGLLNNPFSVPASASQTHPAHFVGSDDNRAIALWHRSTDASSESTPGRRAGITALMPDGMEMWRLTGDAAENPPELSLYANTDAAGSGADSTATTKVLNIATVGSTPYLASFQNATLEVRRRLNGGETTIRVETSDASNSGLELENSNGTIFVNNNDSGTFNIFSAVAGTTAAQFDSDGTWNWQQNPMRNIRVVPNQPTADDLALREMAFTKDVDGSGTPAWLFKDGDGTGHYFAADGTF